MQRPMGGMAELAPTARRHPGSALEVFLSFLKLGVSSFGGPIAHIGYFHGEFVVRRRWLDEQAYADLVALCQFLPGPASSQVGFSIGLQRAGYLGGLAAWAAFTLPSAILMVLFAYGASALTGTTGAALLHGLKLVAVAIVAQAVWSMARTLTPDRERASIAVIAVLIILLSSSSVAQIIAIVLGAVLGLVLCRTSANGATGGRLLLPVSTRAGWAALTAFLLLLVALPMLRALTRSPAIALFEAFYRSGALVFGGGHVVLPLLREAFVTPGWVTDDAFLSGYGAAQAVPGPLFTFAAYLGAVAHTTPHGIAGAALGLIGIFLPGVLILLAALPFWESLRQRAHARSMMAGVNAAVVGLLGAALYSPAWTSSVRTPIDFGLVLVGFVLLTVWRAAPLIVVLVSALGALAVSALTPAHAAERVAPAAAFGRLDHVFLIMMENQTDTDILANPHAPFINTYAKVANQATNYFAVGHPSTPNYLELTGGSNFGVPDDYWPDWLNGGCSDNAPGSTGCDHAVTPIAEASLDNPVVATARSSADCNGQVTVTGAAIAHNCALYDYPATRVTPESIANQLVDKHMSWKSYQESLPTAAPVAGVNYSDGTRSNLSPPSEFSSGPIARLYAVKHNPFVYFRDVQKGTQPGLSLRRITGFDGPAGLWADLQREMPNFAFIVPNQCHDMHGFVAGAGSACAGSTKTDPALMAAGDAALKNLVDRIKGSSAWKQGRNAIVVVWDENDASNVPNRVILLVETNYAANGRKSAQPYDHYSLLRTLEVAFALPCLNHACDATSKVMNDLFGG
jgi:chromate transporter